jgi:hypothetical protein
VIDKELYFVIQFSFPRQAVLHQLQLEDLMRSQRIVYKLEQQRRPLTQCLGNLNHAATKSWRA